MSTSSEPTTGRFVPPGLISVCVPTWNRQPALDAMFKTYAEHYWDDGTLEFSVCDDGSIPRAEVPKGKPRVVLTQLPAKQNALNSCVPHNRAVAASHGDIIVLTCPEITHHGPILGEMLLLLHGPMDYVTAQCFDPSPALGWLAGPKVDYSTGGRLPVPRGAHFNFLAMLHRSLWDKVGGFDPEYRNGQGCDDNDWLWRLADVGARFQTTTGVVEHGGTPRIKWRLPTNVDLFHAKWPEERRVAIEAQREGEGLA